MKCLETVARNWYFNSANGSIAGSTSDGDHSEIRFSLSKKTVITDGVRRGWWNRGPLMITFDPADDKIQEFPKSIGPRGERTWGFLTVHTAKQVELVSQHPLGMLKPIK